MSIFGGNTGITYEQLQQRRRMADQLRAQNAARPSQNIGQGIGAIARALVARGMDKENTKRTEELKDQYGGVWGNLTGSIGGGNQQTYTPFNSAASSAPAAAPDPNSPGVIGADTMAALGKGSSGPVSEDVIRKGLVERGMPNHLADAFVMNFRDESGLDPGINEAAPVVPGSRGGFGLAQWTGPRRKALEQYAQQTQRPLNDVNMQLDFLMQELQGPERRAAQSIMSAQDTPTAATAIVNDFLRPAEENRARRVARYSGGGQQRSGGGVRTAQAGGIDPSIAQMAQLLSAPDEFMPPGQKAVVQALLQQRLAASDPMRALDMQMKQAQLAQMQQPDAPETQYVDGVGLIDKNTGQVIADYPGAAGAGGTEYGLSPQYGVDAQGRPVIIQIGKDGTATQTQLPEGVTFQKEPIRIDAGTHWVLLDPITRQPIGQIEKNLQEAEAEKAVGRAEGESQAAATSNLPNVISKAEQNISLIDSIINDPALASITGMVQGRLPPMSQAGTDLETKIKQLQGTAFLEAFDSLKGGGTITEIEGQKAEQAMARLDRAQSTEAYLEALRELKTIFDTGVARARAKAGQPVQPPAPPAPPSDGADKKKRWRFNPETGELE